MDVAQDTADVKIKCPVLSLWGADFLAVGKLFDMPEVWGEMAENLMAVAIQRCGHLPHGERPEAVNALLLDFLDDWAGRGHEHNRGPWGQGVCGLQTGCAASSVGWLSGPCPAKPSAGIRFVWRSIIRCTIGGSAPA